MKQVELLGLEIKVQFDPAEVYTVEGVEYVITTDGRLISWDDAANSWVQVRRWAV